MAQKHLLHELLKENQEPFHLKSYISDKRSQLKNKSPPIIIPNKPKSIDIISAKRATNLRQHACFFSFQNSPDVGGSPFRGLQSPAAAMSPRKSPAAVFLRVPPRTADILLEAAMRIQKRQKSKPQSQIKNVGLGFFGSFLKILKDRGKNKRIFRNCEEADEREKIGADIIPRRLSTCRQHEELSQIIDGDFGLLETRFCASPFRFSFCKSSSSSGHRTPEFCSPAATPSRRVNQEKENYAIGEISENVNGVDDEETEQCSPVSVLDPFFEDDAHESPNAEEVEDDDEDYDLECSYANVQRAKQQLLDRLRRFEKLAELDPMELERNFLEDSEDEYQRESVVSEDDHEPSSSPYQKQSVDRFLNEAFCLSNLQHNSRNKMCADEKRLVSDPMVEKKSKILCIGNKEVVLEFDMVDMMVELDLKRSGFEGREEETVEEIELSIFGQLVEEFVLHG
ncbi:hypothetical protein PHJA_000955400 [Phtheirospermum japonicum]|uniref:Uncharacterized protein n=1 Tax=Phtheirospermum japonicum TaxID=374723 RepID=A0A830BKZ8_9LAMI|nr:hypothetical protein PHJA_000955400 [Phtheirospermum japonicum]